MRRFLFTLAVVTLAVAWAGSEISAQTSKQNQNNQPGPSGPYYSPPPVYRAPPVSGPTRPIPPPPRAMPPWRSGEPGSGGWSRTGTSRVPLHSSGSSSTSDLKLLRFPHPHPPISGGSGSGTGSGTGQNPWGGYPYYYNPWAYWYGYGYGYGYSPYATYGAYAPIFLSAGDLYGPGPILQLMGVAGWFSGQPAGLGAAPANVGNLIQRPAQGAVVANPVGNPARAGPAPGFVAGPAAPAGPAANPAPNPPDPGNPPDKIAPIDKPAPGHQANQQANDLAMRYLGFGDTYFGHQKYADALDRYKKAAQFGPAIADARFRQGFTLAAMGRYDEAIKVIKAGMEINPDWPTFRFPTGRTLWRRRGG